MEETPAIGSIIARRTGAGKKEEEEEEEEEESEEDEEEPDGDVEELDEVAEKPLSEPIFFISSLIKQKR